MDLLPLDPVLRTRFEQRTRQRMVLPLRVGLCIGAGLFLAFFLWDEGVLPGAWVKAWPARLGAMVPRSEVLATGALGLIVLVVSALSRSVRVVAVSLLLLALSANAIAWGQGASTFHLFSTNLFTLSAAAVALIFRLAHDRLELRAFQLEATLEHRAQTDVLSGTLTRRAFLEAAAVELRRAERYGQPLSVVMLDVDHFKRINDVFGHPVGDEVIGAVGQACQEALRTSDRVGRLGGEEFALLLPHTDAKAASSLAERLRQVLAERTLDTARGALTFTASFGVARWDEGEPLQRLLARADEALYEAKDGGRNQVCTARAVRGLPRADEVELQAAG